MTRAERRLADIKKKNRLRYLHKSNSFTAINDPYILKCKELEQLRGLIRSTYRQKNWKLAREYEQKWDKLLEEMKTGKIGYFVNNGKYTYPQFVKNYTHAQMRQGIKQDINKWNSEEDPDIDIRRNDNKAKRAYEYAWEID